MSTTTKLGDAMDDISMAGHFLEAATMAANRLPHEEQNALAAVLSAARAHLDNATGRLQKMREKRLVRTTGPRRRHS